MMGVYFLDGKRRSKPLPAGVCEIHPTHSHEKRTGTVIAGNGSLAAASDPHLLAAFLREALAQREAA